MKYTCMSVRDRFLLNILESKKSGDGEILKKTCFVAFSVLYNKRSNANANPLEFQDIY